PVTRSLIAAYVSGATPLALSKPEIEHNVRGAAAFTEVLGLGEGRTPRFTDYFDAPDPADVAAGKAVYMEHCNDCHGHRPDDGGEWVTEGAALIHQGVPVDVLGTDDARLRFRYAKMVPLALQTDFPGWAEQLDDQVAALEAAIDDAKASRRPAEAYFWGQQLDRLKQKSREHRLGHPFYFEPGDLTAEESYFNNPIPGAFLRAPYLHNGAVPTMAQLINLVPRPRQFCRGGKDPYDPEAMGYSTIPPRSGACPPEAAFLFDTEALGNSNRGHDYPWRYRGLGWNSRELEQLLAYMKML
ncbi:MAG: hypothetical protein AAF401_07320, partial [Pseudomonadota bacterium]